MRILIADSQPLFADALAEALRGRGGFRVMRERPASGRDAAELLLSARPDVALLDYWLEDLHAPGVLRSVAASGPTSAVLVLAWLFGSREIENSLEAGAAGFIPKSVRLSQLTRAIRAAAGGSGFVYARELQVLKGRLAERGAHTSQIWDRMRKLSRRELQVLVLLSVGRSGKQIAGELGLTAKTVSNYVQNMLAKADARSAQELLNMARNCGLIAG